MAEPSNRRDVDVGDRKLSYIAHPWLRRESYRKRLLSIARDLSDADALKRAGESRAFRALHAAAYTAHERLERGAGRGDSTVVELVELYDQVCDSLFRANLGLVFDMKRRVVKADLDEADVNSDGYLALLRAVRSFDPWMGYRFSTYACRSIIRAFHALEQRKRQDTRRMNEKIDRIRAAGITADTPVPGAEDPALESLRRILDENRADLTSTEQLIITRRILSGEGTRPTTLGAVGKMLNLSKERVRQIQKVALAKLREVLDRELQAPRAACPVGTEGGRQPKRAVAAISSLCVNGRAA